MPRFRVILDEEAERNVTAIYDWIAERSSDGATSWYVAFTRKLDALSSEAERFPVAPESQRFEKVVRNATFRTRRGRTYRVLFTIDRDDVHVLFVRGPGQDLAKP